MIRRSYRCAAYLLLAMYGAVSLTGAALHYLVQEPATRSGHAPVAASVYFHVHAPDFHGHFHHHVGHHHVGHHQDGRHHDESPAAPVRNGLTRDDGLAHQPHACPLLAIAAKLKLGHATAVAVDLRSDASSDLRSVDAATGARPFRHFNFGRGPPASGASA